MIDNNGDQIKTKKDLWRLQKGIATSAPALPINDMAAHVDLDENGRPLRYQSCIQGPDKDKWEEASCTEFRCLLTQYNTITFITKQEVPEGANVTYYNPQVKVKMRDGELL